MMTNIYLLALIGHCLVFSTQAYAFHPCQQLTSRNGVAFLKNHSELHQVSTSYSEPTVEENDLSEPANIQTIEMKEAEEETFKAFDDYQKDVIKFQKEPVRFNPKEQLDDNHSAVKRFKNRVAFADE